MDSIDKNNKGAVKAYKEVTVRNFIADSALATTQTDAIYRPTDFRLALEKWMTDIYGTREREYDDDYLLSEQRREKSSEEIKFKDLPEDTKRLIKAAA